MAQAMRPAWPTRLETREGTVLVSFPDIREVRTEGAMRAEALSEAVDCLVAALGGYVNGRRAVPRPSPARGHPLVELPAPAAAKLALYQAMDEQNLSNVALAKRLGTVEGTVRRLVDLDHRSHIGQVESALEVLGRRLVVEIHAAQVAEAPEAGV